MKKTTFIKKITATKKTIAIVAVVLIVLIATPVIVKAATDGEVDLYAMIVELFTRVEAQEAKSTEQESELEALRQRVAELEGEIGEEEGDEAEGSGAGEWPQEQEPAAPAPTDPDPGSDPAPEQPGGEDGGQDPAPAQPDPEFTLDPDPEPEPDPTPTPPSLNPYADLSLDGVHIIMVDGRAMFGRWLVAFNVAEAQNNHERLMIGFFGVLTSEGIVAFNDGDLEACQERLTHFGIPFTVSEIYIDPRFYEIVEGKTFESRTKAIDYIESVIAGT